MENVSARPFENLAVLQDSFRDENSLRDDNALGDNVYCSQRRPATRITTGGLTLNESLSSCSYVQHHIKGQILWFAFVLSNDRQQKARLTIRLQMFCYTCLILT